MKITKGSGAREPPEKQAYGRFGRLLGQQRGKYAVYGRVPEGPDTGLADRKWAGSAVWKGSNQEETDDKTAGTKTADAEAAGQQA